MLILRGSECDACILLSSAPGFERFGGDTTIFFQSQGGGRFHLTAKDSVAAHVKAHGIRGYNFVKMVVGPVSSSQPTREGIPHMYRMIAACADEDTRCRLCGRHVWVPGQSDVFSGNYRVVTFWTQGMDQNLKTN